MSVVQVSAVVMVTMVIIRIIMMAMVDNCCCWRERLGRGVGITGPNNNNVEDVAMV
jgi:hypothetical protein